MRPVIGSRPLLGATTAAFTLGLCSLIAFGCLPVRTGAVPNLFVYSRGDVSRCLRQIGLEVFEYADVERNASGTELRFSSTGDAPRKALVLRLDGHFVVAETPARFWYMNDAGDFVVWFDDIKRGINFRDGTVLRPVELGFFDVEPGGRYFFIQVEPTVTAVGHVDHPKDLFRISGFVAGRIFASADRLYLFDLGHSEVRCKVVETSASGFSLTAEIVILRVEGPAPSPYYVEDMDTSSGRILLRDVSDGFPPSRWYLFDLSTRHLTRIGWAKGHAFFLAGDIIKAVEAHSPPIRMRTPSTQGTPQ